MARCTVYGRVRIGTSWIMVNSCSTCRYTPFAGSYPQRRRRSFLNCEDGDSQLEQGQESLDHRSRYATAVPSSTPSSLHPSTRLLSLTSILLMTAYVCMYCTLWRVPSDP